jgi:hypothetical protein
MAGAVHGKRPRNQSCGDGDMRPQLGWAHFEIKLSMPHMHHFGMQAMMPHPRDTLETIRL